MSKASPIRRPPYKQSGKPFIQSDEFASINFIISIFTVARSLEMKIKELESRLELEQATRSRVEVQFNRYKDALDKVQQEGSQSKAKEQNAQDLLKKAQKSLRFVVYFLLVLSHAGRTRCYLYILLFSGNFGRNIIC